MSTTSSSTAAKLKRAVDLFKKCTSLTTSQVMQLAGFSPEECSNLSTQRMVRRKLPGNGKRKFKAIIAQSSTLNKKASRIGITVLGGEQPAISPLTNPMSDTTSLSVSSPEKKELKNRLNSNHPPKFNVWTDDDERALIEASWMNLDVSDTALGCLEASKKVDFARTARKFTQEEWGAMTAA
jgi:hypothetical protein